MNRLIILAALVVSSGYLASAQITLTFADLGNYGAFPPVTQLVPNAIQVQTSPAGVTVTLSTATNFIWFAPDGVTCNLSDLPFSQKITVQAPAEVPVCLVTQNDLGQYYAIVSAQAPGFATVSASSSFNQFPSSTVIATPAGPFDIAAAGKFSTIYNGSPGSLSEQVDYAPGQPAGWLTIAESPACNGLSSGSTCRASFTPNSNGLAPGTYSAQVSFMGSGNRVGVSVSYTVSPQPLHFIPINPCRVVDTRNPDGLLGGPILAGGATRSFPLSQGACSIPSSASAYSLNVTIVPSGTLGYLTLWPSGQTQPTVSIMNSDGRIKADAAIVPTGTDAAVSVYASDPTQLVLDINGYFVGSNDPDYATALQYYTVPPCRAVDTRLAPGILAGPKLAGAASRDFPLMSSACGIPASAKAYSLNLTAVPPAAISFLTAWPTGSTLPGTSTINANSQVVTANAAIVPVGDLGDISVYSTDDTDLIIDINGYFAPPGTNGLSLYTLPPCRVADTRSPLGSLPIDGQVDFNFATSSCNLLLTAQAYVVNATVVPIMPLGFLRLWPQGQVQPAVSTLNTDTSTTSNMAIVAANSTNGTISAYVTNPTNLVLDISSYFAP